MEQTVGSIRKAFHFKISRPDKIKHSEMRREHLIKTITHSWRVGAEIMKQSKQASAQQTTAENYREGRKGDIFSPLTRKIGIGFTCTRCSSVFQQVQMLSQIEIGCHVNGVNSLFQLLECCFYHSVRNL